MTLRLHNAAATGSNVAPVSRSSASTVVLAQAWFASSVYSAGAASLATALLPMTAASAVYALARASDSDELPEVPASEGEDAPAEADTT